MVWELKTTVLKLNVVDGIREIMFNVLVETKYSSWPGFTICIRNGVFWLDPAFEYGFAEDSDPVLEKGFWVRLDPDPVR